MGGGGAEAGDWTRGGASLWEDSEPEEVGAQGRRSGSKGERRGARGKDGAQVARTGRKGPERAMGAAGPSGRGGGRRTDVLVLEHAELLHGGVEVGEELVEQLKGVGAEGVLQGVGLLEGAEHDGAVGDEGADEAVLGLRGRGGLGVEAVHDVWGEDGEEEAPVVLAGGLGLLVHDELQPGGGVLDQAEVGGGEPRRELEDHGGGRDVAARADGQDADGEDERLQQGEQHRGLVVQLEQDRAERAEDVRGNNGGRQHAVVAAHAHSYIKGIHLGPSSYWICVIA